MNGAYFSCAHHVRNSLRKLQVTAVMIDREDIGRLAEFKQLVELQIGFNWLKDVYDCSSLLKYLPRLEALEVQGFQHMQKDLNTESKESKNNSIGPHNHLKKLSYTSYHPLVDKELSYIMKNYTNLDKLTMERMTGYPWPVPTVSSSVMLSFMMFIQKCKQFSITFGGVSGENWLMNLFYDGQVDNEKGDHKTDLTIAVQKERSAPYLHRKFELCLLQQDDDQKCNASVELKYLDYGSNDNDGRYESKVKAQLTHLHPNTESITLDCQSEVAEYLDLVLNTPSAHLEKICVRSGKLVGHIRAEDLPPRAPHIKRLAFDYTQIDQAVLPLLSLDFPVLDHLTFGTCIFYEFGDLDHETVASNISMPNTVISTLKIDVLNITAPEKQQYGSHYAQVMKEPRIIISLYFVKKVTQHYKLQQRTDLIRCRLILIPKKTVQISISLLLKPSNKSLFLLVAFGKVINLFQFLSLNPLPISKTIAIKYLPSL